MFVPNLSEAATVRLIETILFGRPVKPPASATAIKRRPRRSPRPPPPAPNPFAASNAEFFRTLILRKRVAPAPHSPVTSAPATPVTNVVTRMPRRVVGPFGPSGPSFPRGLCYLIGVAPSDRAATMLSLGSYPTVQSLLTSWLFQPAGIHLVTHSPGLYHAVPATVFGSIPVCLGLPGWKVGADENFPPLPCNTAIPRPSDNRFHLPDSRPRLPDARPRLSGARPPPRYFQDGGLDPSNRSGGASRGRGDRGLPSFGPYSRGTGRGRGRVHAPSLAPFRPQFFEGDHRGRGRGAARREFPH